MQCPHCDYEHGSFIIDDKFIEIKGEHGHFWDLEIGLKPYPIDTGEIAYLIGCPKCKKTFIETEGI